jgi:hypothetical protein
MYWGLGCRCFVVERNETLGWLREGPPMSRIRALVLISFFAVGCATAPISGRTQLMMLPLSADEGLGQQAFTQLLSSCNQKGKVIPQSTTDSTEQEYLQRVKRVGTRILDATEWRKEYPWKWTY